MTGCAHSTEHLPEGAVVHESGSFAFVPAGQTEKGCTMFSKRALKDGVAVDAAIWFRTESGDFSMDARQCVPSLNDKN